ncbi:MAG: hypothetical protein ACI9WC_001515 [Arenicella sp.]
MSDAQAMSELLKDKYGFKVTTVLNASRDEMLLALEAMRVELTEKDNLLIYGFDQVTTDLRPCVYVVLGRHSYSFGLSMVDHPRLDKCLMSVMILFLKN